MEWRFYCSLHYTSWRGRVPCKNGDPERNREWLFPIPGFSWYTSVLDALSNTHSNPVSVCASETETESIQQISSLLGIEPSIMAMRTVE
jgi:hypothetical protein